MMKKLTIILGVIACIIFFVAGFNLNKTGKNMSMLRSQAGTSLAETYYQEVGSMNKGLGILCYGLGISSLAMSFNSSSNSIKENNTKQEQEV